MNPPKKTKVRLPLVCTSGHFVMAYVCCLQVMNMILFENFVPTSVQDKINIAVCAWLWIIIIALDAGDFLLTSLGCYETEAPITVVIVFVILNSVFEWFIFVISASSHELTLEHVFLITCCFIAGIFPCLGCCFLNFSATKIDYEREASV